MLACSALVLYSCAKTTPLGGGADGGVGGCEYGGKHYPAGASFPSTDRCNQCSCDTSGRVACTLRACADSGPGALSWYHTCGAPLCGPSTDGPTGQPPCTTEKVGQACSSLGQLCDPGLGCRVDLVCATSDPTKGPGGCPISRARYKRDIRYLEPNELSELTDRLLATPIARFRYAGDGSEREQLGFVIEDVVPSPSVEGDHVNLYGYTSMAVAALEVQSARLRALEQEVLAMRAHLLALEQRCAATRQK